MYETDSDNDAPEDVTFQQAKEVSKSLKRNQVSNERVQKLKKREMNKAREDALKEQKVWDLQPIFMQDKANVSWEKYM